jgi:hypothetical protein
MIAVPYLRIAENLDKHNPGFIDAVTGSKTVVVR